MKKLGRKEIAFGGLGLLLVARTVLEWFGESIFGTVYSQNIEPFIKGVLNVHLVAEDGNELLSFSFSAFFFCFFLLLFVLIIGIIGSYIGRRSEKSKNRVEEKLKEVIKSIQIDNENILSSQLYRYSIDKVRKGKSKVRRISIDHLTSEYQQGMDINAIIHEEFEIAEKDYKVISRFVKEHGQYEESDLIDDLNKAKKNITPVLDRIREGIKQVTSDNISENHCISFMLYKGIKSVLGEEEFDDPVDGVSDEIMEELKYSKRTGCLPAILLHTAYVFRNGSSKFKNDRTYLSLVPREANLPKGYKNILVVLTYSYDHVQERNFKSFINDQSSLVDKYFLGIEGELHGK